MNIEPFANWLTSATKPTRVVLELDLNRPLFWEHSTPPNPVEALKMRRAAFIEDVLDALRIGSEDPQVLGLIVHVGDCRLSLAQSQELALAIEEFGRHRPTYAYSAGYGELVGGLAALALASSASRVWTQPGSVIGINGAAVGVTLLKGMLQRLGVDPQFGQRAEYKTTANMYAADDISEPSREMTQALVIGVTHDLIQQIARRRGLPQDVVRSAVDHAPLTAESAKEIGLVDRLGYRGDIYKQIMAELDAEPKDLLFVHMRKPSLHRRLLHPAVLRTTPVVTVINISGSIVTGRGELSRFDKQVGADVVCEQLREAGRDKRTRAVVLRVDSPGGSAIAANTIWQEVHSLRESGCPVVASMLSQAASGGYYVSMGATHILALPGTLTGSIGVLMGKFVVKRLYDMLSIKREIFTAGRNASLSVPDTYLEEEQWRIVDEWLDRIYGDFVAKASTDRKIPIDVLEPLARGRVWTGSQAFEHGLVDGLGGFGMAVERACELGGIRRDKATVRVTPGASLIQQLRGPRNSESLASGPFGPGASVMPDWAETLLTSGAKVLGLSSLGVLSAPETLHL